MSAAPKLSSDALDQRAILRNCFLFQEADDAALDFAIQHMEELTVAKGQPVILQGEGSDHVYFIKSGSIEIMNYIADERRNQRVALLGPGNNFAEFSVLSHGHKSGSAYAYEDSDLIRLHGDDFLKMLSSFPEVSKRLAKLLAELNQKVEANSDLMQAYSPTLLNVSPAVLEILPQNQWKRLGAVPIEYRPGLLSVAMKDPRLNTVNEFLVGKPVDVAVYQATEEQFDQAMIDAANPSTRTRGAAAKNADVVYTDTLALMKGCSLFAEFPDDTLQQLKAHLPVQEVKKGSVFAKPGYKFEAIYLVFKGSFQLLKPIPRAKTMTPVWKLGPGSLIGDVALVSGKSHSYVVRALEDCLVVPFPAGVIDQLMASPVFTIPMAVHFANRLQDLSKLTKQQAYKPDATPNFKEVKALIPYPIMLENRVMPLEIKDGEVIVGTVSGDAGGIVSVINRYLADYRVKVVSITDQQFQGWFPNFASAKEKRDAETTFSKVTLGGDGPATLADPLKLLDEILMTGYNSRASDIHFEPFEREMTVRYRIDGVLVERAEKIPSGVAKQITARLKVLSNMDISNHRTPQDGQLKTTIKDFTFVARASALPVKHGEKVVLRIIRSRGSVIPLNMLVPERRTISILQQISRAPHGLFLVTGPTGSGKTTTLYSLVNDINRVEVNVTTIEDPVELEIPGCNQIEIDKKKGLDFALSLRSVLRQDPDVVMVGEIRDEESARIVLEAAITGHLVLSTLHTDSSLDVPARLKEFGITPANLAAGLLGVLTQRLVRSICKHCVTTKPITASERRLIENVLGVGKAPDHLHIGQGCAKCNNTGYFDRIPVFEVWRKTLEMNSALLAGASLLELKEVAQKDGFETLYEFGIKMVVLGLTTLEEIERNLSHT